MANLSAAKIEPLSGSLGALVAGSTCDGIWTPRRSRRPGAAPRSARALVPGSAPLPRRAASLMRLSASREAPRAASDPRGLRRGSRDHRALRRRLRGLALRLRAGFPAVRDLLAEHGGVRRGRGRRHDLRERLSDLRELLAAHADAARRPDRDPSQHRQPGPSARRAQYPLVGIHPETGRRGLFYSAHHVQDFVELSPEESAMLLARLQELTQQPNFALRHHWRPGQIALWDNRCVQHYVVPDFEGSRLLYQVTVRADYSRPCRSTSPRTPPKRSR